MSKRIASIRSAGVRCRGSGIIYTEDIRICGRVSDSKRKDGELHDDSSSSFGDRPTRHFHALSLAFFCAAVSVLLFLLGWLVGFKLGLHRSPSCSVCARVRRVRLFYIPLTPRGKTYLEI